MPALCVFGVFHRGPGELGAKIEIKNMKTFSGVRKAPGQYLFDLAHETADTIGAIALASSHRGR
jgi:hypothetical protein